MQEQQTIEQLFYDRIARGLAPKADKEEQDLSLVEYLRGAWKVLEPGKPYVHGWHIDVICEHLELLYKGEILRLLINIPPRFTKSTVCAVAFPTWVWTKRPEYGFLTASYALDLATRDSVKSRRIIESPWYQNRWGHVFQLTGDQNVKSRYENTMGGLRMATSVESKNTGEGGDFIICDDPHNVQDVQSATKRKSTLEWWDNAMQNRVNVYGQARFLMIGQRTHESDLSGHVLEGDNYVHLMLPNEFEPERKCSVEVSGWEDPRSEEGELLCHRRLNLEVTEDLKKNPQMYATQYQQRPMPKGGGIFKEDWFRYYDKLPVIKKQFQVWDLTFKKGKAAGSSYVSGQVWGILKNRFFLIDLLRERLDIVGQIEAIEMMTKRHPRAVAKYIERAANAEAVLSMLKNKVNGLILLKPLGDKVARAEAWAPLAQAGNIWLPDPKVFPEMKEKTAAFVHECCSATGEGGGTYWDQIDAAGVFLSRAAVKMNRRLAPRR